MEYTFLVNLHQNMSMKNPFVMEKFLKIHFNLWVNFKILIVPSYEFEYWDFQIE